MELFKINSVDFTPEISRRTYSVQRLPEYYQWKDANLTYHRPIGRYRVSGSFTMSFATEARYGLFLSSIAAVKDVDGYCPVQVWTNNDKELVSTNAFLDFTTRTVWTTEAFGDEPAVAVVQLKITER